MTDTGPERIDDYDDGTERWAYWEYFRGRMTAEQVVAGYADGSITVPTQEPPEPGRSWAWYELADSGDYRKPNNPWIRTLDKPVDELQEILAARNAAAPAAADTPEAT